MPVVIDGNTGITTPGLASTSAVTTTTIAQSATLSDGSNSTSTTNAIQGSAKAWVNFVGATGVVTTSYNVSSVTRASTGSYTINLTTALADANYSVNVSAGDGTGTARAIIGAPYSSAPTTTAFQFALFSGGNTAADFAYVQATFYR